MDPVALKKLRRSGEGTERATVSEHELQDRSVSPVFYCTIKAKDTGVKCACIPHLVDSDRFKPLKRQFTQTQNLSRCLEQWTIYSLISHFLKFSRAFSLAFAISWLVAHCELCI